MKIIEAIYEDGVFKPVIPIKGFKKHQRVSLSIGKPVKKRHPLADLYGTLPDEDAKEILDIVKNEFEKVNINEW